MSRCLSSSSAPLLLSLSALSMNNGAGGDGDTSSAAVPVNESTTTITKSKRILMIRHGRSLGNDMMGKPGNQWGDSNFTDDATLIDSPLSELGIQQAMALAINNENDASTMQSFENVELVVVSPLTRTLQTMQYAVLPNLNKNNNQKHGNVPIIAHPLSTERVYTTSDTGRSVSEIRASFQQVPEMQTVNYDLLLSSETDDSEDKPWWYHHPSSSDTTDDKDRLVPNNNQEHDNNKEWRPNDGNQWYGVPGEPQNIFDHRMSQFETWLSKRPEQSICIVGHWGVLRHMTGGYDFHNCEAKWVEWEYNKEAIIYEQDKSNKDVDDDVA